MAEFGYNVALDSATGSSRKAIAQKVTLVEDGTLNSISVYTGNRALTDLHLAIYSHDAINDAPLNLIESHNLGSAPGTLVWRTISGFSSVLTAGTYWLVALGMGDKANWGLSAPVTTKWQYSSAADYTLPNPWVSGASYTTRAVLIYGTYTLSGGGDLSVSASDSMNLSESLSVLIPLALSLISSDPISASEYLNIQVQDAILDLDASAYELIIVTDHNQTLQDSLGIVLHEEAGIVEFIDQAVDNHQIQTVDIIPVSDFPVLVQSDCQTFVSDSVGIADSINVLQDGMNLESFDPVQIFDSVQALSADANISSFDDLLISDSTTVFIPFGSDLYLSVSDSTLMTDYASVLFSDLLIDRFDFYTISDFITSTETHLESFVSDSISIDEFSSIQLISLDLYLDISDFVSFSDGSDISANLINISSSDLIATSDFPQIYIPIVSDLYLSALDSIIIADQPNFLLDISVDLVSDFISISEFHNIGIGDLSISISDEIYESEFIQLVRTSIEDREFYIIHSEFSRNKFQSGISNKSYVFNQSRNFAHLGCFYSNRKYFLIEARNSEHIISDVREEKRESGERLIN